jgi:hypothetical protein
MKFKLFAVLLILFFVASPSYAGVGPLTWAANLYHAAVHTLAVPADVVEYVTGKPLHKVADALQKAAAKVDEVLDKANNESK